jgi:hypothetical protein
MSNNIEFWNWEMTAVTVNNVTEHESPSSSAFRPYPEPFLSCHNIFLEDPRTPETLECPLFTSKIVCIVCFPHVSLSLSFMIIITLLAAAAAAA